MENNLNLISTLFKIKSKPGMYLGTKSATKLKSFIDGYIYAMNKENIECGSKVYYSFNDWFAENHNIRESILWDIFLLNETNDEKIAFDLFFKEFEIFLDKNNIKFQVN